MNAKNVFAAFVVSLALQACGSQDDANRVETATIQVKSAVCGTCQMTIKNSLTELDGVKSAEVDIKAKTATVQFLPAKLNLEALEGAITSAGYDANEKKADPKAYEDLDECCKIDLGKGHH
jgi:periplasmic mercuric ion binding protein